MLKDKADKQSKDSNSGSLILEPIFLATLKMKMSKNRVLGRQEILRPKVSVIFGKIWMEISKMCIFFEVLLRDSHL